MVLYILSPFQMNLLIFQNLYELFYFFVLLKITFLKKKNQGCNRKIVEAIIRKILRVVVMRDFCDKNRTKQKHF